MVEHLLHRRACFDHQIRTQSFGQEVPARALRIGQVDVAEVVDDLSVELLGDTWVEAAVPRLHVEDGHLPALAAMTPRHVLVSP